MPKQTCNSGHGVLRLRHLVLSPEATETQRGSKRGILKNLVSHVLNFKSWIKLTYDKITYIYCVINEINPTFDVQKMENEAFQNASYLVSKWEQG